MKKSLKYLVFSLVIILFYGIVFSQTGPNADLVIFNKDIDERVVYKSEDPTPEWINHEWYFSKDKLGKKVIYIVINIERQIS